jgi:hypothetical protein
MTEVITINEVIHFVKVTEPKVQVVTVGTQGPPGTGGDIDHASLNGLEADDHPQYHTDARGDVRYYTKAQVDAGLAGKANAAHGYSGMSQAFRRRWMLRPTPATDTRLPMSPGYKRRSIAKRLVRMVTPLLMSLGCKPRSMPRRINPPCQTRRRRRWILAMPQVEKATSPVLRFLLHGWQADR